jgi:spermidine synthase
MLFEELDYRPTPRGTLSLRRRRDLAGGGDIHEIKLDDAYLMSSAFTAAETELGRRGTAAARGEALAVVVGGLGLGYTAQAALQDARVSELLVIDALPEVIEWHRRGLLPLGPELCGDPRCRLIEGDFFAMAAGDGFDPEAPGRRFDAVLVDIDHAPDNLLHPDHATFYTEAGLAALTRLLRPGGVFALWSNDPPDPDFSARLEAVFAEAGAEEVAFDLADGNPGGRNTIYLARTGDDPR